MYFVFNSLLLEGHVGNVGMAWGLLTRHLAVGLTQEHRVSWARYFLLTILVFEPVLSEYFFCQIMSYFSIFFSFKIMTIKIKIDFLLNFTNRDPSLPLSDTPTAISSLVYLKNIFGITLRDLINIAALFTLLLPVVKLQVSYVSDLCHLSWSWWCYIHNVWYAPRMFTADCDRFT